MIGDRYAGEWVREPFRQPFGIDYQLSEASKSDIYRDALLLFNAGRGQVEVKRLVNQLCRLERRTARRRPRPDRPSPASRRP